MKNLFVTSGYLDDPVITMADGKRFDLCKIPPFLRVLLTTDGTVTKSLESFFWEPVAVHKVFQGEVDLVSPEPFIHKVSGDSVLKRDVVLEGRHSRRVFARATSYICTESLPVSFREDLAQNRKGIGEFLRESSLETYRELMGFGLSLSDDAQGQRLWRTYRIVWAHVPCIQITETFNVSVYR